jgi:hypothetical protein
MRMTRTPVSGSPARARRCRAARSACWVSQARSSVITPPSADACKLFLGGFHLISSPEGIPSSARIASRRSAWKPEACGAQRALGRPGRGFHAALLVGEQVDVLGVPVDEAVHDQRVAAGQGDP